MAEYHHSPLQGKETLNVEGSMAGMTLFHKMADHQKVGVVRKISAQGKRQKLGVLSGLGQERNKGPILSQYISIKQR